MGATAKNDKVCKLCSYIASDMIAIRHHLMAKHNIDLETPNACLVEPDFSSNDSRSGSSSPLPSSSSEKKTKLCFNNSTPAVSITRTSVTTKVEDSITSSSTPERRPSPHATVAAHEAYFVKQEADNVEEEAKDLSMKSIKRPASPTVVLKLDAKKIRHKTGGSRSGSAMTSPKSPMLNNQESSFSSSSSTMSQFQCQHCSIIFPNVTLYFLHRGFHSSDDPWRCNNCGHRSTDMYDFNTHLMSDVHH